MIYSFNSWGYEGALVSIEVDLRRGIPATDIVGLADGTVKESRERMRAAIRNSGFEYPSERVLISLSPADLRKEGAAFDLPLALAVIAESKSQEEEFVNVLVMGELDLSGHVRPVKATHGALSTAFAAGIEYAIVPKGSDIPEHIKVCEVENLEDAVRAYLSCGSDEYFKYKEIEEDGFSTPDNPIFDDYEITDFDKIEGHAGLKYAMAVAAAGRHSILTWGAPGCGKTLMLQHYPLLMPRLTKEEALSTTRIWSLAGLTRPDENYIKRRPFRMPHQTASIEGMCGGGPTCRPGEISLAHNGILFLDEAAEFRSSVLQMLRVPLENGTISLSRGGRTTTFPAKFQLFMAANPCPCGNYGSPTKICLCSAKSIEQYWKKFSAPLLDRVAIRFDAVNDEKDCLEHSLSELRELITRAWKAQYKRQGMLNQDLSPQEILDYIPLTAEARKVLDNATLRYGYSPRTISNILKVARTLVDMHSPEDKEVGPEAVKKSIKLHGHIEFAN